MTDPGNSTDPIEAGGTPDGQLDVPATRGNSLTRAAISRIRRSGRTGKVAALIAAAAILGGAYVVGGPPSDDHANSGPELSAAQDGHLSYSSGASVGLTETTPGGILPEAPDLRAQSGIAGDGYAAPAGDTAQIVKTGQMTLEVTDLDGALSLAQATIAGMGGFVDQSNRSGTGDYASASITFRFPVDKWDAALPALRKIGAKVLSEQTNSTDVTSQVIDLDARLDNLKKTEAALQAIMARATAIPDVIAVETQLSQTQGQIEQLTAQRDHLANQAAMSTVTVTFQLPSKTVTTIATQDWTLGSQVDEAAAALVRIGQGLATIVVWMAIVVLPIGLAGLILLGLVKLSRRIFGRSGRRNSAVQA